MIEIWQNQRAIPSSSGKAWMNIPTKLFPKEWLKLTMEESTHELLAFSTFKSESRTARWSTIDEANEGALRALPHEGSWGWLDDDWSPDPNTVADNERGWRYDFSWLATATEKGCKPEFIRERPAMTDCVRRRKLVRRAIYRGHAGAPSNEPPTPPPPGGAPDAPAEPPVVPPEPEPAAASAGEPGLSAAAEAGNTPASDEKHGDATDDVP